MNATTPTFPDFSNDTMDMVIEKYVRLRDTLKVADDAHKAKVKPYKDLLEHMEGILLQRLDASGVDSAKTKDGTAYKTLKKSATIADGGAFRQFVIGQQAWDICDWKANSTAVADYLEAHKALPPGVNFTITFEVGVRRPTAKK